MTKTSVKNIINTVKKLGGIVDYEIVFEDKNINVDNKKMFSTPQVMDSDKFIFVCPKCNIKQTSTYSSLNSFLKKKTPYCINSECEHFSVGRRYGLFDVQQKFSSRDQTLLDTEYINCRTKMRKRCNNCDNISLITLLEFENERSCDIPGCKSNETKLDENKVLITKLDKTGEKNIRYDIIVKNNGFELISEKIPKREDEICKFRCKNKHEFESKMTILKNIIKGKKISNFCKECSKDDLWNKNINTLKDHGIVNIITKKEDFKPVTSSFITFTCSDKNHEHKLTISGVKTNSKTNNGKFSCRYCTSEMLFETKKCIVEERLKLYELEFISLESDLRVLYKCGKCLNPIKTDYRNIMHKNWCGLCRNCIHSDPVIANRMAHGSNGQKNKIMELPNGKTFEYQGYEDIVIQYLLTKNPNENIKPGERFSYTNINGVDKTYEPDLIVGSDIAIEVKSDHTYRIADEKIKKTAPFVLERYLEYKVYIVSQSQKNITILTYTKDGNTFTSDNDPCIRTFLNKHKNDQKHKNDDQKELSEYISNTDIFDELFEDSIFEISDNIMNAVRKKIQTTPSYLQKLLVKILNLTHDTPFPTNFIQFDIIGTNYNKLLENNTLVIDNRIVSNTLGIVWLNYFTLDLMLQANNIGRKTIHEIWGDEYSRYCLWESAIKNKTGKINPMTLVQSYAYKSTRIYNFPPNISKGIYNHFKSKRVLDFCAGYGGRLLGFWQSGAEEYVGIDPNTEVKYDDIISWLQENTDRDKKVTIINKPAEDVDFKTLGIFDLVFTSPPYFNVEIYSDNKTQSCNRYKDYELWKDKFLFNTLNKIIPQLNIGGYLAINIKNVKVGSKKYNIADDMVSYLNTIDHLVVQDSIEMVQPKRSKTSLNERIYIYKKIPEIIFEIEEDN